VVDPRLAVIDERLKGVGNIIAVSSGKGGVGKSMVASSVAVILARRGFRVGLFDLDFTSPSTHVILGAKDLYPEEENGIIPPRVHGLEYMSIVYYSGNYATPLRGVDVSNALIELLAITKWKSLDFLIIDMPPGIGDATLDIVRLIKNIKFLIVTTPSQLAFETVKKMLHLLSQLNIPIMGIIENMKMNKSRFIQQQVEGKSITFWGEIQFDIKLEEAIGDIHKLLNSEFGKKIEEIINTNVKLL
jgi:ATP-binding protein involved in chromosome partitioning